MSDETTTANDEVEAHGWGGGGLPEDALEDTMEAQDDNDEPDVEGHIGGGLPEDLLENIK
jgi:hypothetical protein